MAEANTEIEGINYYSLLELPDSQDKNAPCVLLVHALMSNLHMYDTTVKQLHAAGYSTLRYDHVGLLSSLIQVLTKFTQLRSCWTPQYTTATTKQDD